MVEMHASLILDLGAGDQVLAETGRELALTVFCEAVGVEPSVHLHDRAGYGGLSIIS